MAETPSSYKRFAQSDKISQGTTNAALSLNDYLPGQHVTGPNNNDIAATLAQVQAIPIGTATLSGKTYNVTISNYPNTATIYPGQKISVKFNADAPTADDTALNLSAFGQSLPLCARGVRMGQGAIKSGMILELVYRGDMWNADYDVVKANRDANGYTTFADGSKGYSVDQVNNALAKYSHFSNVEEKSGFKDVVFQKDLGTMTGVFLVQLITPYSATVTGLAILTQGAFTGYLTILKAIGCTFSYSNKIISCTYTSDAVQGGCRLNITKLS